MASKTFKKFFERVDRIVLRSLAVFLRSPKQRELAHQFIKFSLIGVVNTIIDFGIYATLTRHTTFFYYRRNTRYLANAISFLFGTTFSFFANRNWTFGRTDKASLSEASRFYTTTLSGLAINSGVLYLLSHSLAINDLISKVFSTFFSTVWNFSLKRLWVFNVPQTSSQSQSDTDFSVKDSHGLAEKVTALQDPPEGVQK